MPSSVELPMKVASVLVLTFIGVAAFLRLRNTTLSVRESDDQRRVLCYPIQNAATSMFVCICIGIASVHIHDR